jgi:uncharacterized protein (DUF362 family)
MKLHPWLTDPDAVLVYQEPVPDAPAWDDFRRVARNALAAMRLELDGEKAVLKPNVTSGEHFANPDTGIDTHPAFVGGLAEYLREHGARRGGIYVVEDPRDSDDENPRHWKGTGYLEMAGQTGAKLRCPNYRSCVRKPVPRPLVHASRRVSRLAVAPDSVLINVPKLKTHNLAITTLCMKNLMGLDLVYDRHYCGQAWQDLPEHIRAHGQRPRDEWMDRSVHELWQEALGRRLADLAQVVPPRLNVVEGVVGRDGTGFNRGRNYALGLVVAGVNVVAVDAAASYLMGFDPTALVYLKVAASAGLGQNDVARLRVYTARDGELAPCRDVAGLRHDPPFTVITGVKDEQLGTVI